jgi:Tfp pilus assembly protein PilV
MRPARCVRDERGMTLIEVMVAAFVLIVGVLSIFAVMTSSRDLTSKAETLESATHIAERELEAMQSLTWSAMAHTASPASGPAPYTVSGSTFQHRSGQWETIATATTGTVPTAAGTWNDGRLHGRIWRFVTWRDDPATATVTNDYKRLTVVVTVETTRGLGTPIVLQTFQARKDGV